VMPSSNHLQIVSEILDACPNWYADLSWDLVQTYMVDPKPGMPSFDDWVNFVTKYQDRLLWGSDTVIYTRNKTDDKGNPVAGKEMPIPQYYGFHAIRHFMASYLMDEHKVSLKTVSGLLRHKNVRTTEIYLHSVDSSALAATEKN
jgi:integrase